MTNEDDEAQEPTSDTSDATPSEGQPEDPAVGNEEPEPAPEDESGTVWMIYQGHANVFRYRPPEGGDPLMFKPGVPVEVPKAIAEDLATYPHERFEVTDDDPTSPPVEE